MLTDGASWSFHVARSQGPGQPLHPANRQDQPPDVIGNVWQRKFEGHANKRSRSLETEDYPLRTAAGYGDVSLNEVDCLPRH